MMPEMVGPMAGATEMTIEIVAHRLAAVGRRHQGHHRGHQQRHHDRRAAGLHHAADHQHLEARASAAISVPALNSAMAAMKIGRVLNRCNR